MAGVIKSKGNEIFTQGVRQVNTDTGSRFVTEALQRATNRITDATYAEAVKTERETGRQAAITTPIKCDRLSVRSPIRAIGCGCAPRSAM